VPDATPTEALLLKRAFETALQAAAPSVCLPPALEPYPRKPALVLGTGKAAASMTAAFCAHWGAPTRGLVVTRYGHGLEPGETSGGVEVVEAGHPSPDESSLAAGARLLELAASAREDEYLICLISGGGSSLAAAPMPPITFEQKRAAANYLIRVGADIREINCVRKHLSKLKGGRLAAAAHPSPVITFVISDIPGDEVGDIASGPTIPDATTQADARAILERCRYPNVAELMPVLGLGSAETPKPGAPEFSSDSVNLIATASTALDAAMKFLRGHGYEVVYLGADLADEAQDLGRRHAKLAKEQRARGLRVAILSGGETRVVLGDTEASGRGGRNTEYIASLALELDGCPGVFALAADTDGIDGHGDHAGAFIVPETLRHGAVLGASLATLLARHDTYSYFDSGRYLVKTGPTRTNVNDFRLILCHP
jgi:hydroxypyruvate reductase